MFARLSNLMTSTGGPSLQSWQSYATGIALAAPFLERILGWSGAIALFIPWLILTLAVRPRVNFSLISILFLGLVLWHSISMWISPSKFSSNTYSDSLVAVVLIFVASTFENKGKVVRAFSLSVLALGLFTSMVGLFKLFLMDRGFLLGPILKWCPSCHIPRDCRRAS